MKKFILFGLALAFVAAAGISAFSAESDFCELVIEAPAFARLDITETTLNFPIELDATGTNCQPATVEYLIAVGSAGKIRASAGHASVTNDPKFDALVAGGGLSVSCTSGDIWNATTVITTTDPDAATNGDEIASFGISQYSGTASLTVNINEETWNLQDPAAMVPYIGVLHLAVSY